MIDPATGMFIASTAINLGKSLFGKSDEEKRRERYEELLKSGERDYREAKARALARVQKLGAGQQANSRQAAIRRASALGRGNEAESFILPAEQRSMDVTQRMQGETEQHYDDQWLDFKSSISRDFADRPIEPDAWDYVGEGLGQGANYLQKRDFIDAIGKYGEDGTSFADTYATAKPVATMGAMSLPQEALSFNDEYAENPAYNTGIDVGKSVLYPTGLKYKKRLRLK